MAAFFAHTSKNVGEVWGNILKMDLMFFLSSVIPSSRVPSLSFYLFNCIETVAALNSVTQRRANNSITIYQKTKKPNDLDFIVFRSASYN